MKTDYLTTAEAGERLRQTSETVARRCAAGEIPATRVGRRWLIAAAEVSKLLKPTNTDRAAKVSSTAGRRSS